MVTGSTACRAGCSSVAFALIGRVANVAMRDHVIWILCRWVMWMVYHPELLTVAKFEGSIRLTFSSGRVTAANSTPLAFQLSAPGHSLSFSCRISNPDTSAGRQLSLYMSPGILIYYLLYLWVWHQPGSLSLLLMFQSLFTTFESVLKCRFMSLLSGFLFISVGLWPLSWFFNPVVNPCILQLSCATCSLCSPAKSQSLSICSKESCKWTTPFGISQFPRNRYIPSQPYKFIPSLSSTRTNMLCVCLVCIFAFKVHL